MSKRTRLAGRKMRQNRGRKKISGTAERPRLSVFISNKQIYTQIIDDNEGRTIASASTLESALKEQVANKPKTEVAELIGARIAQVAGEANIKKVVFDKSGFKYGKRLSAMATAARKGGLVF